MEIHLNEIKASKEQFDILLLKIGQLFIEGKIDYTCKWDIRSNSHKDECPTCQGFGEVSKPPYDDSDVCPHCNGSGDDV